MKKLIALFFASVIATGLTFTAFAADDVPNPADLQASSDIQATQDEAPIFNARDYQLMHDDIGVPTAPKATGPAFGSRYGEIHVEMPSDVVHDDTFTITSPASLPVETPRPANDTGRHEAAAGDVNNTADHNAAGNTAGNNAVAHNEGNANNNAVHNPNLNPRTGAPGMIIPLIGAALALGIAPIVRGRK